MFVHDALCEVIQCGDTEIPAARLGSTVETMSHTVPGDTSTGFQQQFEVHYYSNWIAEQNTHISTLVARKVSSEVV